MFKWPGIPSPRARGNEEADYNEVLTWKNEIADFGEFLSLQTDLASDQHISNQLAKLEDNDYTSGVPVEDDLNDLIGEAFVSVQERAELCGDGYPFHLNQNGTALRRGNGPANQKQLIYKYLLLATRLNMAAKKKQAGLDGTELFEELCAVVARNYFGENSQSFVFGTANGLTNFEGKVDDLCTKLGEGRRYRNVVTRPPNAKDDGLDVVVWTPFSDRRASQLIGFGQCKTGTNYDNELTRLQPGAFCANWFEVQPAVNPIRMFFVAEALLDEGWEAKARLAGILLDRCRIIKFSDNIPIDVINKLTTWTEAAAQDTGIGSL